MKLSRTLICMCTAALFFIPMTAFAGVEGTYTIDGAKLLQLASGHIQKSKVAAAIKAKRLKRVTMMIKSMKMQLHLHKGGKYSSKAQINIMGMKRKTQSTGTWSAKGNQITILSITKNKRGTAKATVLCTLKGKSLSCNQKGKKFKRPMFFKKIK